MAEFIDREVAKAKIREKFKFVPARIEINEVLNSIPAADVRPVVRGKWTDKRTIEHDGEWYCTACGKEITIYMGADREDRYAYCPNCGARMEES